MGMERVQFSREPTEPEKLTTTDLVNRLVRFDGPPEEFLLNLLAVQCEISSAQGAAILRAGGDARAEVLTVYPQLAKGATAPVWLAQSVELAPQIISAGSTSVKALRSSEDLYGQPARRHLVMIPLRGGGGVRGMSVFVVEADDEASLAASRDRLELTSSLLSLYEMRLTLQRRQIDLQRLRMAMETLAAVNENDRFIAAAMGFCNEIAARWQCERVGLGFLKGRYVHLRAMSHTEKFSRKMKLVQDIESAMEECLDQDVEVLYPPSREATYVSRASGELSTWHGPTAIVNLPLRRGGDAIGVATIERPADRPFSIEEIESLRLTCELCTSRLVDLYERDRWLGAKAAGKLRKSIAVLVGPKHTWIKAAAVVIFAAAVFVIFAKGDYRVEGPFVLEATTLQVLPAPFEGYLKDVFVDPSDRVKAGETVLARLDTVELRLQLASARAERIGYLKQADTAMRDGKTAEAQIAQAQAYKIAAQMALLEYQIRQAEIVSPISGYVVKGDLKRQIGAPVETGQVLFEVAPLEALYAELSVPEDEIAEVTTGQEGRLATVSYPDRRINFVVRRINPVAEVVNERNVFKVRVNLEAKHTWMRPGMEGVAKITIGKRRYLWIWTRRLVNWIRMKLWI